MAKIGVFPASGGLGGSIAKHLLQIVNATDVILICRHPEKLPRQYLEAGVVARKADYDEPDSFEHAFDDISCLFLVSYPSIQHEHRFNVHKRAIDAAKQSTPGVSHLFYSSLGFTAPNGKSIAHVMQAHLSTERYLSELTAGVAPDNPLSWTVVREGIYSETWPMYTGFPNQSQPVLEAAVPGDFEGPGVSWVKRDELGEASAQLVKLWSERVLEKEMENATIFLSGPRVWSLAETLNEVASLSGKEALLKQVSVDEYVEIPAVKARLSFHGPGRVARQWATTFEAVKAGETAITTDWLERLLQRKPEDFQTTLRGMLM